MVFVQIKVFTKNKLILFNGIFLMSLANEKAAHPPPIISI